MINDRLKPHVHKVKGARFLVFFDVLNGDFYHYQPGNDIREIRRDLKEAGLIFETGAVVPYKTVLNVLDREKSLVLRKLQVRLNGHEEDNCWNRKKIGPPKKEMTARTAQEIIKNLQHLPIDGLIIEAETYDKEIIVTLANGLQPEQLLLVLENPIDVDEMDGLKQALKTEVRLAAERNIPIREINTEAYDFFYVQSFNPCLGHQVAIDTQGEIKPCLWWPRVLGNIYSDTVRDLIFRQSFEPYWNANKNSIKVCKDCEYRFNCHDCRLNGPNPDDNLLVKPVFCSYDPYTGKGYKETGG